MQVTIEAIEIAIDLAFTNEKLCREHVLNALDEIEKNKWRIEMSYWCNKAIALIDLRDRRIKER